MAYMYNHDRIDSAITMATRTRRVCREIAQLHCPYELPDSVLKRIYSRRKLYNFLESLDLSEDDISSIFYHANLPVPRKQNRRLKPSAEPRIEPKIDWLIQLDRPIENNVKIDVDLENYL